VVLLSTLVLGSCDVGSSRESISEGEASSRSSSRGTSGSYNKVDFVSDLAEEIAAQYLLLQTELAGLDQNVDNFCADTRKVQSFQAVQQQWRLTLAAWQRVQGINFGPVNVESRRYRVAYYPLNHDRLASRISALVASGDDISEAVVAGSSADLQGLTAMEVILFRENALVVLNEGGQAPRYCHYLRALSTNLQALLAPVAIEWGQSGSYRQTFTAVGNVEQSLEDWFGSVAEHLQIIRDTKLRQVAAGVVNNIEAPYAQESLNNIANNLVLLRQVFDMQRNSGLDRLLEVNDLAREAQAFTQYMQAFSVQSSSLEGALLEYTSTPEGLDGLEALAASVHEVLEYFAVTLASGLDVYIGFNGADGD